MLASDSHHPHDHRLLHQSHEDGKEEEEEPQLGLQPVCPHKAVRFLKILRAQLAPQFLINETLRLDDFERELKIEYLRA